MVTETVVIMPRETPEIKQLEQDWINSKKILVRGMVSEEAARFLEDEAFADFGMMKKGALGMELTKLLLIAKECIERQRKEE